MNGQSGLSGLELRHAIEQLVDGELTGEQYRLVVSSLEQAPGGWRACGLAFLEAQALGRELRDCGSGEVAVSAALPAATKLCAIDRTPRLHDVLAMAASVLVAFVLGLCVPRFGSPK